ncbi:hypothetical protein CYMTET_47230 [Cymbomonas tetramitiformis]|uniref:Uncharacterized protein n=1 Tax=Cymbomonas tetramitiformis TaxID=36881 RepID=A0AAE0BUH2_9CHLO|nr:hypothetical protein CYMTET_47230 [Cymbomonas tetramitiformis]
MYQRHCEAINRAAEDAIAQRAIARSEWPNFGEADVGWERLTPLFPVLVDNGLRDVREAESIHSVLSAKYPLQPQLETRISTKAILGSALKSQTRFKSTAQFEYLSDAAELKGLSEVTAEDLERLCVPITFFDDANTERRYVSGQIAGMWLLLTRIGLTIEVRSDCLLPMYKNSLRTTSNPDFGTNMRLVCMPPGTGKTAVVIGACEALMKGPSRESILGEADVWAKQMRATSRTGNFTTHGGIGRFAKRSMAVVVAPDNVYAYWHGSLRSMVNRAVTGGLDWTLFPSESSKKLSVSHLVAAVDRATVESGACVFVLLTPDHFKKFLLLEQQWVWPVTVFDEISAHFRKLSNTPMPLCKELWGMTATPTDLSDMMDGVAKNNPIKVFLGEDYQQCNPDPKKGFMKLYPTEATKILVANVNVLLLLTIPVEINRWISDQMSDLMFAGVACVVNSGCGVNIALSEAQVSMECFVHVPTERPHKGLSPLTRGLQFTWEMWREIDVDRLPSEYRGEWHLEIFEELFSASNLPLSHIPMKYGFVESHTFECVIRKRRADQNCSFSIEVECTWFPGPACTLVSLSTLLSGLERAVDLFQAYEEKCDREFSQVTGWRGVSPVHCEINKINKLMRNKLAYLRLVREKVSLVIDEGHGGAESVFAFAPRDMRLRAASEALLCARCACCFTFESLFVTGWWKGNLQTELGSIDATSEIVGGVRCPNCYIWLQPDREVSAVCNARLARMRTEHAMGRDATLEVIARLIESDAAALAYAPKSPDDEGALARTHFPYPPLPCGVAYALDFALRDAILRHKMRRFVIFCDRERFEHRIGPILDEVTRWSALRARVPAIDVGYRSLLDGSRGALKAVKGNNLTWYSDMSRLGDVRILHLNNQHSDDGKEETHGMNLANTDMLVFVDSTPNSVQAVSRGLRAGRERTDKWLVVYRI